MKNRYIQIVESFGADALGRPSISVYFSFCDKAIKTGCFCPNCHNKELQKDGVGYYLDVKTACYYILEKYNNLYNLMGDCTIVFVGGEPTAERNFKYVKALAKEIKFLCEVDIFLYTWKTIELLDKKDFTYIDYIICGEYKEELLVDGYAFATKNQYMVDKNFEKLIQYLEA